MPVTAVSLFSGCGGFDRGARHAGVQILWANDRNRHAAATYRRCFPDVEFVQSDIRKVALDQLPEADLLIGCYPCQGFSTAAWRRWHDREARDLFQNPDNYLLLEFVKAIPHVHPKFVFIENVSGLKSSAGGLFFQAQREMLEEAGYTVSSACLNAHDYGLAQSRRRIFIVGVSNAEHYEYAFPQPTHGPERQSPYQTQRHIIASLPEWPAGDYETASFHGHYLTRQRKRPWDNPSYTIVADSHQVPLHPLGELMRFVEKDSWELRGAVNRRLSWRECALLQSFGADFEPEGTLETKYMQIGNAVPPRLAELIVRPAVEYLENAQPRIHTPPP